MMKNTYKRGFTLIELLVVIAIIGILASVVLASLNTARDKGANAAARSSLNNARAQAELYYDDNSSTYTTVCTAGTNNISALLTGASDAVTANAVCFDVAGSWAASIDLNNSTEFYCVDSTGFGGDLVADPVLSDTNTTCS
jgi:prepilin-type N-terminal cleavage/methylation domain-containing protein